MDNVFEKLRKIVNKFDPGKIYIMKEVNWDEYDTEIEKIIEKFLSSKNFDEFYLGVYSVFAKSLGVSKKGSDKNIYYSMAKEIYSFLSIFQKKNVDYLESNKWIIGVKK